MQKANQDIRALLFQRDVRQWELAKRMHVSESVLSRKLRCELSKSAKDELVQFIEDLAREKA